jgi:hypothetical protein
VSSREQRRAFRLPLEPGQAWITTSGANEIELIDLSASGVSVALPRAVSDAFRGLTGELKLGDRRVMVQLEPVRRGFDSSTHRVGARFVDPTHETLSSVGDFLIEGFLRREQSLEHLDRARANAVHIRNSKLVFELLREKLIRRGLPLCIHRRTMQASSPLFAAQFEGSSERFGIVASTEGSIHDLSDGAICTFLVPDSMAVSLFSSRVKRVSDRALHIDGPVAIEQCGFREYERRRLSSIDDLVVRATHPRSRGHSILESARDLSAGGYSFAVKRTLGLILPGDVFLDAALGLPSGQVSATTRVRRVAPTSDGEAMECGVEITGFRSKADQDRWERYVLEKLQPRARFKELHLERAAWNVLTASGYLDRWTDGGDRERRANHFRASWQAMAPEVGRLLDDHPTHVGTFAASRVYPRTWLVHSFGVDKRETRRVRRFVEVARDLYSALVFMLQTAPDVGYFGGYFDRDQRWGDVLYGDFVAAYADRGRSVYDEFRLFKWCDEGARMFGITEASLVEIALAGPAELRLVSDRLRETVTPLEFHAFSYAPDEIDLSQFGELCRSHGSERSRDVYVAREGGRLAAALVAETGSEGESVFGLLDRCSIVWWPDVSRPREVKEQLLTAAIQHYSRLGRNEAVLLDRDEVPVSESGPFRFVSAGRRWLADIGLISAWRTYVDEVLRSRIR